jgi:hypothetical protein
MTLPARPMPKPTAQVQPCFDVLGPERMVDFRLQFGGAGLHFSTDPNGRGAVAKLIGPDTAKALAETRNRTMQKRVPLAKRWQGRSVADIARTLRATDVSVRGWLKDG